VEVEVEVEVDEEVAGGSARVSLPKAPSAGSGSGFTRNTPVHMLFLNGEKGSTPAIWLRNEKTHTICLGRLLEMCPSFEFYRLTLASKH
jgi:hypothetical protein